MIRITRLNGEEMMINADLIEFIETTPDTVISMNSGKKIIVSEKISAVFERIIQYKQKVHQMPLKVDQDELDQ